MAKKEKKKDKFNTFGLIALILWNLSWCWWILALESSFGDLIGTQGFTLFLIAYIIIIDIIAVSKGNQWLIIFGFINLIYDMCNFDEYILMNMAASLLIIIAGINGIKSNDKANIEDTENNIESK